MGLFLEVIDLVDFGHNISGEGNGGGRDESKDSTVAVAKVLSKVALKGAVGITQLINLGMELETGCAAATESTISKVDVTVCSGCAK